jgi:cytochrome P450
MTILELDFLEVFVRARDRTMGRYTYRLNSLASKNMITTNDPENIQAMLATQFHDFDLGIGRKKFFFDVIGNGIFTAEHDDWAHYRPMLKPQFSRVQIEDLESAGSHLDILLKALPDENKAGWIEKVDLMPFLYRFTMDVSTEFLFGESVNSQSKILHAEDSSNSM